MTGTDVITNRARYILTDTDSGSYRWADALLIVYLNDGVRLITELKPETLLTGPYTMGTITPVSAIGDTVSIGDRYLESLVDYVAARAFSQDAQDKQDLARANSHYQQFLVKAGVSDMMVATGRRA